MSDDRIKQRPTVRKDRRLIDDREGKVNGYGNHIRPAVLQNFKPQPFQFFVRMGWHSSFYVHPDAPADEVSAFVDMFDKRDYGKLFCGYGYGAVAFSRDNSVGGFREEAIVIEDGGTVDNLLLPEADKKDLEHFPVLNGVRRDDTTAKGIPVLTISVRGEPGGYEDGKVRLLLRMLGVPNPVGYETRDGAIVYPLRRDPTVELKSERVH